MSPPVGKLERASHTERGTREVNQDAVLCTALAEGTLVAAVADGMGGLESGERAARTALRTLKEALETGRTLPTAMQEANRAVREEAEGAASGTTLVVAVVQGDTFRVASVGDSRAYHRGPLGLVQLTLDHTMAAEAEMRGDQAGRDMARTRWGATLTRSMGAEDDVEPDEFGPLTFGEGDWLVLTSDGVHGVLDYEAIDEILGASSGPDEAVAALVGRALAAGSEDNVSAVVVRRPRAAPGTGQPTAGRTKGRYQKWDPAGMAGRSHNRHSKRSWAPPGILAALAVVAVLLVILYSLVG